MSEISLTIPTTENNEYIRPGRKSPRLTETVLTLAAKKFKTNNIDIIYSEKENINNEISKNEIITNIKYKKIEKEYPFLFNILKKDIPIEEIKFNLLYNEFLEKTGKQISKECLDSIIFRYNHYIYKNGLEYKISKLKKTKNGTIVNNIEEIIKIYHEKNPNSVLDPETFFGDTYILIINAVKKYSHIDHFALREMISLIWENNYYFWINQGYTNFLPQLMFEEKNKIPIISNEIIKNIIYSWYQSNQIIK